jgi:hypothetical protein
MMKPSTRSKMPPIAAPTPIPAFAPVDRPELELELAVEVGLDVEVADENGL